MTTTTYKLVATIIHDDEFDCVTFQYKNGPNALFTFSPEAPESGDWTNLVDACKNNKEVCCNWAPINGETQIHIRDGKVSFFVDKRGDGQGGSLEVTVPAKDCIDAFETAAKAFSK